MYTLRLGEDARFSNREMIVFILPVIFEQLMLGFLGIVDTFMVSSLGEISVAGVALVNRIDTFAKQFLSALGTGGGVVLAQYIGARDRKNSESSLENNVIIVTAVGIFLMAVMVLFKSQIIGLLFGGAKPEVLKVSNEYFSLTALSYPFTALYYTCTAQFRVMGRSQITFIASFVMMGINLVLKYIFIYKMNLGVSGAALSTLIAMALMSFVLLLELKSVRNKINIEKIHKIRFRKEMSWRILKISVPNGIEQGMFQLGALLIASLVSGLGTVAIAADQIARNVAVFANCMSPAFAALMMTVVGQCMGAEDVADAKKYVKHILILNYIFTFCFIAVFLVILKPVVSVFSVSDEAKDMAVNIMILYGICSMFFYPSSFVLPSALRGAGDTKFVMYVASASMFLFRIGAAYFFVHILDMGVMGTWVAMVSDWVVRTSIFFVRYKKGKWQENKVI